MDWETCSNNFGSLLNESLRGPVVPFIGSGVMAGISPGDRLIPIWSELLDDLVSYAIHLKLADQHDSADLADIKRLARRESHWLDCYQQANLVKLLLGRQYLGVLRKKLYESRDLALNCAVPSTNDFLKANYPFLHEVVRFCRCSQVPAVVTYNYDDTLVRLLADRDAYQVSGQRQTRNDGRGIPIYHIHGFLEDVYQPPEPDEVEVVLSLDEYFHNMMQPYSWQTSTQLHFLSSDTCVFMGASIEDMNMLRVLNYAKSYSSAQCVYAIMAAESWTAGMTGSIAEFATDCRVSLLKDAGVKPIVVERYTDLPGLVSQLADAISSQS